MHTSNPSCEACLNTNCILHKHARDLAMTSFLEKKNTMKVRKGQNVIIEGSPIHGLYFVKEGIAKVYNTGINGREQILRFALNGEVLGQRGFSTQQYYAVSSLTLEETTLCHFSTENLQMMLKSSSSLAYDFMVFYAEELNRSETKVRKFAQMTVREKVIDSLLYINRKFGHDEKGFLKLTLSRRNIADFAGTTEEQVIRTLSALKKEKLLKCEGKKIGIVDIDKFALEIDEHHYFLQS